MKNKKGFTLVELLAVIAILAILAGIATPIVISVQKSIKNKMYDAKRKMIEAAADQWAFKDKEISWTPAEKTAKKKLIKVSELCTKGVLTKDENCISQCTCQSNPVRDNANMDDCQIQIELKNSRYKITFPVSTADDVCKDL